MRIVLLLQDYQAIAYQYRRQQCESSVCFESSGDGLSNFVAFLRAHKSDEFIAVLDYEAEQLQVQHIPRVGRRDQASLLARQRRSHFGASTFAASTVMEEGYGTRRTAIHYGLPADACDKPWLRAVDQSGVRVRSVHWLSLLPGPLVSSGRKDSSVKVVLLRLRSGDDRVLVLHGRQPLMVRRIAATNASSDSQVNAAGAELADQVAQTVAYLDSAPELKTPQSGGGVSPDSMAVFGSFTSDEVEAVQQKLGISSDRTLYYDPESESLNNHLPDAERPEYHSIQEAVVRSVLRRAGFSGSIVFRGAVHLQRQLRHAMIATGISLLMGGAVALAASRHIEGDMSELVSFAASIDSKAIDIKKANAHPEWSAEYPIDAIKESVTYLNALNTINQATPFHFVVSLSEQLTQHPEVMLQSIEWSSAAENQSGPSEASTGGANESDSNERFNAVVTGSVAVPLNGQSEAMNRFRSFVASIRDAGLPGPSLEVTVVELPFAAASARTADRSSGKFTLEIYSPGNLNE
jgi:hypothetical protein